MNPPRPSTVILGSLVVAAGILFETNSGFNKVVNVFAAAFFGIGPEAGDCQRPGAWRLCLPVGETEGVIKGFSNSGNHLVVHINNLRLRLQGIVPEGDGNNLSGSAFNKFWGTISDPKNGGGYADCAQEITDDYRCLLKTPSPRDAANLDVARIAIRNGIAKPAPDAPNDYVSDWKQYIKNAGTPSGMK